jgi:hypothetical protein
MGPWMETDRNGLIWTNLCTEHHETLDKVLKNGHPPLVIKVWVQAQGGTKKAAQRFVRR